MGKFKDRFFTELTHFLSQRTGIDLGTLNSIHIESIIAKKINSTETKKLEEFYFKIIQDPQLFNNLIEDIVIPETSFFRHAASFAFLKQYCLEQNKKKNTFRVLSVPCSTGEEPYSIAITLLEAGIPPSKITVDAFDISGEAIAQAITGKYKEYAFRFNNNLSEEYHLQKYFEQEDKLYCIKPEVKSLVNFKQGNLVSSDFLSSYLSYYLNYDIIFCRNVLIYFSDAARQQVLHKLYQSLDEQGLLFIGYAETSFISLSHFNPLSVPNAFVYEKLSKKSSEKQNILQASSTNPETTLLPKLKQPTIGNDSHQNLSHARHKNTVKPNLTSSRKIEADNKQKASKSLTPSGSKQNSTVNNKLSTPNTTKITAKTTTKISDRLSGKLSDSSTLSKSNQTNTSPQIQALTQEESDQLLKIRQLANQGALGAALEVCQKYIKERPTHAGGYLLLGEIYQAKNLDLEAYNAFKKALYLDPKCSDSLTHLIFLSEQQQNYEQADRYRQRLQAQTIKDE